MKKELSIDSVKNNLLVDIDKAIILSKDSYSKDVFHVMKDLINNNLKEVKNGILNKSIEDYLKGML